MHGGGGDEVLASHDPAAVVLANGIGSVGDLTLRRGVFERLKRDGFHFATVVHPQAICEDEVELGEEPEGVLVTADGVTPLSTYAFENELL